MEVWGKLFQKKTWANNGQISDVNCMPLNCMLKDGDSVHIHVKAMTEVFDALSSRKKIEYLLAYPESYSMLEQTLKYPKWNLLLRG